MVDSKNNYSVMQKKQMNAGTANMSKLNHKDHNDNPDYWDILLADVRSNPEAWEDKKALDFGCGCGRNVENLLKLAEFERVDGIDISETNIEFCKGYIQDLGHMFNGRSAFHASNGVDVKPLLDDEYDFIMSTIVLQHICVHSIRYSIMSDLFRTLKPGGVFSFQMNYGPAHNTAVGYREDFFEAKGTNSMCDTRVDKPEELITDLSKIGFKNITHEIRPSYSSDATDEWIYVRCEK